MTYWYEIVDDDGKITLVRAMNPSDAIARYTMHYPSASIQSVLRVANIKEILI